MKRLFWLFCFSLSLPFCTPQVYAQTDSLYTDSVSPYNHKYMMDSCFADVDLNGLSTGILIDKALSTVNVNEFDGTLNDSNYTTMFLWRRAYGTLRRAFVDSTTAYDTLGTVVARMKDYLDGGVAPITLFNYFYETIKDSAFADSLLTMDETGIQLHDVDGIEQSPYEVKRCFMASVPFVETDTNVIAFTLPQELYITNDTAQLDYVEVDFGDGNGGQTMHFGDTVLIIYDTTATERSITVTVHFKFTTEKSAHTKIQVGKGITYFEGYSQDYNEHYYIVSDEDDEYENDRGRAHVYIHYHCNNTSRKLLKPFVVVTGFATPKESTAFFKSGNYYSGVDYFSSFFRINSDVYNKIIEQEYDLVFVTFVNPTDYIQRNAKVIKKVLREVNELKNSNGSTAPNILLGQSMGGLVSRYALGEMHGEHVANPSTKPDHDVRIFYTQDSPHHGVNIAMGLQALTLHHYLYHFVKNSHVSRTELEDLVWDYLSLISTSGRQMVINSIFADNSLHTTLYSELESVAPVSGLGCKSVFISDGSGDTVHQFKTVAGSRMYLSPSFTIADANFLLNPNKPINKIVTFSAWATPDNSSLSKTVFYGAFFTKINNRTAYYYKGYAGAVSTQWNGLDGMPGSFALTTNSLVGGYVLTTYGKKAKAHFPRVCFIPSISGISVTSANKTNFEYEINANQSTQTFSYKRHITTDENGVSSGQLPQFINDKHAEFTEYSLGQFMHDIVNTAPANIGSGQGYNYALPVSDRIGNCTVQAGGWLGINTNEEAGGTGDTYNNNLPAANSTYRVETINKTATCAATVVTITVHGDLELGSSTNNLSGNLVVRTGSKLILQNNSTLNLYNNSKLIIQQGAELEIEGSVNILLNNPGSIIDLKGTLKIEDNTVVNVTGEGSINFDCPNENYCNVNIDAGSTINLTGEGRAIKMVTVTGKGIDLTNLEELNITTAKVELGTNSEVVIGGSMELNAVRVSKTTGTAGNHIHKGLEINSPTGKTIAIDNCIFEYGIKGLTKTASSSLTQLVIENTTFTNCSLGLKTNECRCNLVNVRFDNCVTGWKAEDMSGSSDFRGYVESVDNGIDYEGDNTAHLFIYESTFKTCNNSDNAKAILADGDFNTTISCTHFEDNDNDIKKNRRSA
jgi:hypothetical protein